MLYEIVTFEETCIRHGKRFGEECGRCKMWMILFIYLFNVSIMVGYFHAYHLMIFVTWANQFFFFLYFVLARVDRLRGGEAGFRTASSCRHQCYIIRGMHCI